MKMFLGRRSECGDDVYELGTTRNQWTKRWGFEDGFLTSMCAKDFENISGVELRRGQVVRVNSIKFDLA